MSTSTLAPKDPADFKDYAVNWGPLLTADGESGLSSSTWSTSSPPGLTVSSTTATSTRAIVWVSNGERGRTYGVTNRITTPLGRTHERTIYIPCRQL